MSRRLLALALCASFVGSAFLSGCDGGATTGTTPESHDADKQAGHMVHPAGGPNSPDAKAKKAE